MPTFTTALALSALAPVAKGFFLMGVQNYIATERVDPIMYPGNVSNHVHTIMGGSNFGLDTNISALRDSECTSMPIAQDKSNYWFPHLYFQWSNGSYTSLDAASTVYYLYDNDAGVKAFPDGFRMIAGDENLRTFDNSSVSQRAISYKCLQFDEQPMEDYNGLPPVSCPAGIRAQINFPSCWDGQNTDSEDHKSHMAYPSGGSDKGTCDDPKFNVTVPRVFMEVSWYTMDWDKIRDQAMNSSQPYVLSNGDTTGYSYHADYIYAWEPDVLQTAIDTCQCMTDNFGAYDCCEVFEKKADGERCYISSAVEEQVVGTLDALPGYEPYSRVGNSTSASSSSPAGASTSALSSAAAPSSGAPTLSPSSTTASSSRGDVSSTSASTVSSSLGSAASAASSGHANAASVSASGATFAPESGPAAGAGSSTGTGSSIGASASTAPSSASASSSSSPAASGSYPPNPSSAASLANLPIASTTPPIISGPASVFTDAAPAPIMTSASAAGAGPSSAEASGAGASGAEASGADASGASAAPSVYARHRRFVRAKRPVA
ncbi:uncharacterized protein SCHCODRAFT_02627754 [Schizophyllum commune H4-8]|uniref:DUF1996 domain-containing protein n=1 Tax=Schizophyllum commune (strain H4-8 / FGSC 9210) TaxID=578458 RepID=D8Q6F7_SCHCM|nr:uncharacterized protein SCHCODRAFT_02627754 [Schizophyllum commune H4-8]KAI5890962.1 hypothetical protein SCHCODRAFT_02627754 [Schizophyllum commune H4-8]